MKDNKIRVAVVGTGFGNLVHIPAYYMHDRFDLVGIYGRNQEKTEQIANKYGIKTYKTKEEIAEDAEVDLISIASIVSDHYQDVKMFLSNKKYVILEKPMALTYEQTVELEMMSKKYGVKTAICHEHKYDSSWSFVKHLLDDDVYGKLRCVYFDYSFTYWNSEDSHRKFDWFSQKELGGGLVGGHLSHVLDLISYIDETGIYEMNGNGFIEVKYHYDNKDSLQKQTAEDTINASVLTNQGTPIYINISAARFEIFKKVTLFTENAKILIYGQNDICIWNKQGKLIKKDIPSIYHIKEYGGDFRLNSFMKLLDDFYDKYIEGKKSFITDFSQGCRIQKLIDQIKVISKE